MELARGCSRTNRWLQKLSLPEITEQLTRSLKAAVQILLPQPNFLNQFKRLPRWTERGVDWGSYFD
jgi:hypothetical protein